MSSSSDSSGAKFRVTLENKDELRKFFAETRGEVKKFTADVQAESARTSSSIGTMAGAAKRGARDVVELESQLAHTAGGARQLAAGVNTGRDALGRFVAGAGGGVRSVRELDSAMAKAGTTSQRFAAALKDDFKGAFRDVGSTAAQAAKGLL